MTVLQDAEDDDAAVRSIAETFGLPSEQAKAVLHEQFGLLVQSRRAEVAERPVVLITGLDGRNPVRVRIWPSRSTSLEYADD